MATKINNLRQELKILIADFTSQIKEDRVISRYSRLTNNPIFLLFGITIFTSVIVGGLNIIFPIPGGYLDAANLLILMLIATIIWIPITTIIAWRVNRQHQKIIRKTRLMDTMTSLIELENQQISQQISSTSLKIEKPSPKAIEDLLITDSDRAIFGPRNSKYQLETPIPLTIEDTDDYFELSGRLLRFSTPLSDPVPVDRILLQGQSDCVHKTIIFLSKEKQYRNTLALTPRFSPILKQIKQIVASASTTSKFAINITRKELTLIIHDYRDVSSGYLPEILNLLTQLRDTLPKLLYEIY